MIDAGYSDQQKSASMIHYMIGSLLGSMFVF